MGARRDARALPRDAARRRQGRRPRRAHPRAKLTAATAAAEGRRPPPVLRMCRTKGVEPAARQAPALDGAPKPAERMDCKDFREAWNLTRGGGMNLW